MHRRGGRRCSGMMRGGGACKLKEMLSLRQRFFQTLCWGEGRNSGHRGMRSPTHAVKGGRLATLPVVAVYLRWTLGLGLLFLENRVWECGSCSRGSRVEPTIVAGACDVLGGLIIIFL